MTTSTPLRLVLTAALAALLPAAPATAQEARAAKAVNVRAGPGRDYPLVVQVGAGAPLAVQGCLDNYSWCDVVVPGPNYRGWVYAGNIAYPYQSAQVPLLQYGAVIGLPIVGFAIGSYWGDHYRGRPWYRDRGRWANRPVPHGPAFRPGPRFGEPGHGGPVIGRPPGGRPFDDRHPQGGPPGAFGPGRHGPGSPGRDRGPGPDAGRPSVGDRPGGGDHRGGPGGGGHGEGRGHGGRER